jgi:hypothetical protein
MDRPKTLARAVHSLEDAQKDLRITKSLGQQRTRDDARTMKIEASQNLPTKSWPKPNIDTQICTQIRDQDPQKMIIGSRICAIQLDHAID